MQFKGRRDIVQSNGHFICDKVAGSGHYKLSYPFESVDGYQSPEEGIKYFGRGGHETKLVHRIPPGTRQLVIHYLEKYMTVAHTTADGTCLQTDTISLGLDYGEKL